MRHTKRGRRARVPGTATRLRDETVYPVTDPPQMEPDNGPGQRVADVRVLDVVWVVRVAVDDHGHGVVERVDLPEQQVDRGDKHGHGVLFAEQPGEPSQPAVRVRQPDHGRGGGGVVRLSRRRRRRRHHDRRPSVERCELLFEHVTGCRVQTLGGAVHEQAEARRQRNVHEDGGRGQAREPPVLVVVKSDYHDRGQHAYTVLRQASARLYRPAALAH